MTVAALLLTLLLAPPDPVIRGTVVDATKLPLVGVTVSIEGTDLLAITDAEGRFTLSIPAPRTIAVLQSALPGFRTAITRVALNGEDATVAITLELDAMTDVVSVAARKRPLTEGLSGGVALKPLDVVRIPGAQADLFRALHALPGVVTVDEGAGLFVRGGDVSEVLVMLDGATLAHPYRHETPTGGFRGAVDPFLTEGAAFSTGGFSARYGNVLSAVVDLRGLGRPSSTHLGGTAGLAGASASFARPIGGSGGVRVNANRADTRLLFAVNGSPRQFDRYPAGWDISGSGTSVSNAAGSLKLFAAHQRDEVGVVVERDAFAGLLHSNTRRGFTAVRWDRAFGPWLVAGSFGNDDYTRVTDVGVIAVDVTDVHRSARLDATRVLRSWTVQVGAEYGFARTSVDGTVPQRGGDLGGVSGALRFLVQHSDTHAGVFGEVSRTFGRVTPTIGVRTDRFDHARDTTVDPRVNVSFEIGRGQRVRAAWGFYSQAPAPDYYDTVRGAADLSAMRATHYIAGYEAGSLERASFLRVEGYRKTYRHLPLEDLLTGYSSNGYGDASGLDVYARRVWARVELRGSASWLDASRRWTSNEQRERYPLPAGAWTPDFAIPFSMQVTANVSVTRPLSLAATWRTAAGRPYTPVVSATATPSGYEPIYASINSARLPRYERLDVSASWMRPIGSRSAAIFFAGLDNVLGRRNFFEYAYSPDYSIKRPVVTTTSRAVYIGASFTR